MSEIEWLLATFLLKDLSGGMVKPEKGDSMTKEELKTIEIINQMSQIEMASLWRNAPAGHPCFDMSKPFHKVFEKRFKKLGGFTPAISKAIGQKMKRIIKLFWAWIDWKKLCGWIKKEGHYAIGVCILIFVCTLFLMLAVAEHNINQKLNHLELRINDCDKNIPQMVIE